jgi:transposase
LSDRDSLRLANRHSLGRPPTGDGLRFGNDVLATSTRLAEGRSLGETPRRPLGQAQRRRSPGLESNGGRFVLRSSRRKRGATGPNPTDRRRSGSKHHLVVEGQGIPLHAILTAANRHDVTQLLPLIDGITPVRGKVGHPRRRPDRVFADRAYDSEPHRQALRDRGIRPYLAKRRTKHGSGLGKHRWVVERTFAWLHQFRRLRVRYERRADIHEAFLKIGCALITWRFVNSLC